MNKGKTSPKTEVIDPKERVQALVDQVDEGYGRALVEQLMQRLDLAARDFAAEIDELLERLKNNAATQEELRDRIRQHDSDQGLEAQPVADLGGDEITEWEKRLANLEESAD